MLYLNNDDTVSGRGGRKMCTYPFRLNLTLQLALVEFKSHNCTSMHYLAKGSGESHTTQKKVNLQSFKLIPQLFVLVSLLNRTVETVGFRLFLVRHAILFYLRHQLCFSCLRGFTFLVNISEFLYSSLCFSLFLLAPCPILFYLVL